MIEGGGIIYKTSYVEKFQIFVDKFHIFNVLNF
jgi:hypothetical protein